MVTESGAHALDSIRTLLMHDQRPLVLGVSGGVDSMVLLHLCAGRSAPTLAVHVNHGLRATADDDAALVTDACTRLGVDVRVAHLAGEQLRNSPFGVEGAARAARYNVLAQHARSTASCIVTAHHANDRLETLLMRLGQGAGVAGLAGPADETQWDDVSVWRPLLNIWKSEILHWGALHKVLWSHDEMNDDACFERVKIRREIVPAVLDNLPPEPLRRSLRQLADDAKLLHWLVARELQAVTLQRSADQRVLDRGRLRNLPEDLCRAVVHQALLQVLDRADRRARPESRWVFDVVSQLRRPGPSVALGRRVRCEITRTTVRIGYMADPRQVLSTTQDDEAK